MVISVIPVIAMMSPGSRRLHGNALQPLIDEDALGLFRYKLLPSARKTVDILVGLQSCPRRPCQCPSRPRYGSVSIVEMSGANRAHPPSTENAGFRHMLQNRVEEWGQVFGFDFSCPKSPCLRGRWHKQWGSRPAHLSLRVPRTEVECLVHDPIRASIGAVNLVNDNHSFMVLPQGPFPARSGSAASGPSTASTSSKGHHPQPRERAPPLLRSPRVRAYPQR